ncbi:MAG: hypothetical protein DCC55_22795 [Chloroflexi bacterium]|nr:MAG: hypothetical protein DCC55_22795 [Chloroflexota bacterium]
MSKTRSRRTSKLPTARSMAPTGNQAADYGARIQEADAPPGATYWKIVGVRHLSPDENRGKHNIYIDAIDEAGQRVRNPDLRIAYTWEGRRDDEPAPPRPLDKPDNEPAGNLDVYKGQVVTAWLQGDGLPSDRVAGLHTDHDDEPASDGGNGNTRFHHSFHVLFQRAQKAAVPVVTDGGQSRPEPAPPPTPAPTQPGVLVPEQWVGVVTATQLNLRQGPGTEHVQIGSLFQGTPVTVTGRVGEWLNVLANGQQGFVHGQWVQRARPGAGEGVTASAGSYAPPADQRITLPPGASAEMGAAAETWNNYGGLLLQHAAELGIDPGVAVAVLVAESRGKPYGPDGRMIIRFENHIFYHYWGKANEARFRQHFTFDPNTTWQGHQWRAGPNSAWQPCHANQAVEWQVFEFARSLDEQAAMYAISMGAPQVMGFNHRAIGYDTVQQMFHDFQADVRNQIASLFRFMRVNGLVDAVRQGDYGTFARVYNGPGQADYYAGLIRQYRAAFDGVRSTAARTLAPAQAAAAPMPSAAAPAPSQAEAGPALDAAWRNQISQGFEQNQTLFRRTMEETMNPQWLRQVLEDHLMLVSGLYLIYNEYWTRLSYLTDPATAPAQLSAITQETLAQVQSWFSRRHTGVG